MDIFLFVSIGVLLIIIFIGIIIYLLEKFVCSIRYFKHRKLIEFLEEDDFTL